MASPALAEEFDATAGAPADKAKAAWNAFAADASGYSPFKMVRFVPRSASKWWPTRPTGTRSARRRSTGS